MTCSVYYVKCNKQFIYSSPTSCDNTGALKAFFPELDEETEADEEEEEEDDEGIEAEARSTPPLAAAIALAMYVWSTTRP